MTDIEEILKATGKWSAKRIQLLSYTNDFRVISPYSDYLYDYLTVYIGAKTKEIKINGSIDNNAIEESINRREMEFDEYEKKAEETFEKLGSIIFEHMELTKDHILDIEVVTNTNEKGYKRYLETIAKMSYNKYYFNKKTAKITTRIPSLVRTIMQIQMAHTNEQFEGKIYAPGKVIEINF